MSSLWSNAELLYCMPAIGANMTAAATSTIVTGNSTTNPPCFLPPLANIWPTSGMQGKGLKFVARGNYDTGTAFALTYALDLDSTQGSAGIVMATSGAYAGYTTGTTGCWELELDCTCILGAKAVSSWYCQGHLAFGIYNATAAETGTWIPFGGNNTAALPTAVTTVNPYVSYYPELWVTSATAQTAFYCSQFLVYALN